MRKTTTVNPSHVDPDRHESIENKTKEYMITTGQWREGAWKDTDKPFELDESK